MAALKLSPDDVINRIKEIIATKTYLVEKDDRTYEGEIYTNYNDELEQHTLNKIFKSDDPREAFDEMLMEWYMDCEWDYRREVIDTVADHFDSGDGKMSYSDYTDVIREWIDEHVFFNYPYKNYLEQEVCVDIIIDTGDGSFDYSMNELFGCNYSEKGYREPSSLVWLMKQQGYAEEQIREFIENEDFQNSKLLESIYAECLNTTTCMNALTFFATMTVEECFNLHNAINNKENTNKTITISKDIPCGLYDPWNGAGSVLEIQLEKDVVLPMKYIDSAYPDGCRGYSVDDIYGMPHSFWRYSNIKIA